MGIEDTNWLQKFRWSLPWLVRYPFLRLLYSSPDILATKKRVVFVIANHFEVAWSQNGDLDLSGQLRNLDKWHKKAREIGESVRDFDGTKFRHTNYYPAEQYNSSLVEGLAELQSEGLGEIEIHLHHGVEKPDTAENLRRQLIEFRDILAEKHRGLSRLDGEGIPRYSFVHGNLALANSCGGRFCGVDEEMQILSETGCYSDLTLPSAPDQSQVPMINMIYECGRPLHEPIPHRIGKSVEVNGKLPVLPLIFTGPLVFNWTRRIKGLPIPRIEDGALAANQPMDFARFNRWRSANVTVRGQPDWVFVKLYCHGFFDHDQDSCIGDRAKRFFSEIIEESEKSGQFEVYFATAREAFNMTLAAIDGKTGSPGQFRDYRLKSIMSETTNVPQTRIDEKVEII